MGSTRVVVLGVGNAERGDDGAGRMVARLLKDTLPQTVEVIEHDGEATSLLAMLDGSASAYLIDACVSKSPPGTIHRIDANREELPHVSSDMSTHGFGLAAAIELGRVLNQLPAHVVVYAIEGKSFDAGAALSEPVAAAVPLVAEKIRSEIAESLS